MLRADTSRALAMAVLFSSFTYINSSNPVVMPPGGPAAVLCCRGTGGCHSSQVAELRLAPGSLDPELRPLTTGSSYKVESLPNPFLDEGVECVICSSLALL